MANVENLIMGAGYIYTGPVGTATEPADAVTVAPPDDATNGSSWTDVGYSKDGVTLSHTPTYTMLEVDQEVDNVAARLTKREFKISTNMAEPTLETLVYAWNSPQTPVAASGETSIELDDRDEAVVPSYSALIFDGFAPGGDDLVRRVIARRVINMGDTSLAYTKDSMTVLSVEFTCFKPTEAVSVVKIIDEDAA